MSLAPEPRLRPADRPQWPGMDELAALLQLNFLVFLVGRMLMRAACSGGLRQAEHGDAFDGRAVGVFDGAEAGVGCQKYAYPVSCDNDQC